MQIIIFKAMIIIFIHIYYVNFLYKINYKLYSLYKHKYNK